MSQENLFGYIPNKTIIHNLSGSTKLISFILLSLIVMTSFDTRFLVTMTIFSLILFYIARIPWRNIKVLIYFVLVFSILNLLTIYIFEPEYGVQLYNSRTVLFEGIGRYTITTEQLFYEFNVAIKYFTTIPLALIFIFTTDPSEFASSLNRIGVSYRISYAVSLALRYIPDIQDSFFEIRQAQQARGLEMSRKTSLMKQITRSAQIIMPLIFSSLNRIETISQAMELRRFGKNKSRTWYRYKPFTKKDFIALALIIIITVIGVLLFFVNDGRFYNPF
ncbi:energy-coupling factor transporter transmembrane protein EcfT [Aerococcaceae bacterium INB8]|uniref:Energy-coupling factor transporter transmembrane protein EcfT n=1 Tax=Ruoffia halotolerans TaxID=2748684 RepID=A0A839A4F1_9LACT|nr:energy-coupling factor transporter transmembrane component T [Ruoffia halotolerans]MBA5728704.1 energy-coupling factor transporter transmembrane protein EcfT [Ruoffia halotolerans]